MTRMFALSIFFMATNSMAFDIPYKNFNSIQFQLGTWLERFNQLQESRSGEKNGFEITPFLSAGLHYPINERWHFQPEFLYVIRQTQDSIDKDIMNFQFDFGYKLSEKWIFFVGSSLLVQTFSSDGGEEEISNGNSTETFYLPEERRTTYFQTLDLGISWKENNYGVKLHSYLYSLDENFPQYSITLATTYNWDL